MIFALILVALRLLVPRFVRPEAACCIVIGMIVLDNLPSHL